MICALELPAGFPARRLLCSSSMSSGSANLLPFATSDVPGFSLTRNTRVHYSVRLWGHLGPLWADSFSLGLSQARVNILRGYARSDATGRWIADFLVAPEEGATDPGSIDFVALAQAAHSPEEGAPLVLTQFALDGAPDLGSVLYLEVRGQDHLGFLGSVLHTLARLALSPRELIVSTRDGQAFDRFYLQTVSGQVPPDEARRALARTLEATLVGSRLRTSETALAS
jgi:hypothetical protein